VAASLIRKPFPLQIFCEMLNLKSKNVIDERIALNKTAFEMIHKESQQRFEYFDSNFLLIWGHVISPLSLRLIALDVNEL